METPIALIRPAKPGHAPGRWRLPPGLRVYAVGDVHGRDDLLQDAFARIDADRRRAPPDHIIEVMLGDYIDRGPASRQVIDRLIARGREHAMVFLKGNHETRVDAFLRDPDILIDWQPFGALETFASYGMRAEAAGTAWERQQLAAAFARALPANHVRFLEQLRVSYTCGDFFFVHAGVRPGVPLAQQREHDLLWIRNDFLSCEDDFGKMIVHGHTPVPAVDIRPNHINIDTGAYASGILTAIAIEDGEVRVL